MRRARKHVETKRNLDVQYAKWLRLAKYDNCFTLLTFSTPEAERWQQATVLQATGTRDRFRATDRVAYILACADSDIGGMRMTAVLNSSDPDTASVPTDLSRSGIVLPSKSFMIARSAKRFNIVKQTSIKLGAAWSELQQLVVVHLPSRMQLLEAINFPQKLASFDRSKIQADNQTDGTDTAPAIHVAIGRLSSSSSMSGAEITTTCLPAAVNACGFTIDCNNNCFHQRGGDTDYALCCMLPQTHQMLTLASQVLDACHKLGMDAPDGVDLTTTTNNLVRATERWATACVGGDIFGNANSYIHFSPSNGYPISKRILMKLSPTLTRATHKTGPTVDASFSIFRHNEMHNLLEQPTLMGAGLNLRPCDNTDLPKVHGFYHAPMMRAQNISRPFCKELSDKQSVCLINGAEEVSLVAGSGLGTAALLLENDTRRRFTTSIYEAHLLPVRPHLPLPNLPSGRIDGIIAMRPMHNFVCAIDPRNGELLVQRNEPLTPGWRREAGGSLNQEAKTVVSKMQTTVLLCSLLEDRQEPAHLQPWLVTASGAAEQAGDGAAGAGTALVVIHNAIQALTKWILPQTANVADMHDSTSVAPDTYKHIATALNGKELSHSDNLSSSLTPNFSANAVRALNPATRDELASLFRNVDKFQASVLGLRKGNAPIAALVPMLHTRHLGIVHDVLPLAAAHKRGDHTPRAVLLVSATSKISGLKDMTILFINPTTGTDADYFSLDERLKAPELAKHSSVRHALGVQNDHHALLISAEKVTAGGQRNFTTSDAGDEDGKHWAFFSVKWKPNCNTPTNKNTVLRVCTSNRSPLDEDRARPIARMVSESDSIDGKTYAAHNLQWGLTVIHSY